MIKVLIADDERPEREFLERIIQERFAREAEIRTAENGRSALTIASLWAPDIVLLDIEMPGLSGIETAKQLLEQKNSAKIIFITAYSLFSYAHEAVKLGVSDYILKPVEADDLVKAIRKAEAQMDSRKELENYMSALSEESEGTDKASVLVSRVKNYIKTNYMAYDLSLESVSDILGVNASYLSSLFKKHAGVNFVDYVLEVRINAAKELLEDPLRSASEISEMVGYESSSYFTRAFKRKTGITPTEYRKQILLKKEVTI